MSVIRILVAEARGSAPRGAGTVMQVTAGSSSGTIGGGALEWQAMAAARQMLRDGTRAQLLRLPLGPALGQCCGGAVVLVLEREDSLPAPRHGLCLRPVATGAAAEPPLALRRLQARARDRGALPPGPVLSSGWLAEPAPTPARPLWIWGAGHVGRALVSVLSPLPDFALHWCDSATHRFPAEIPPGVTCHVDAEPATLVPLAPPEASHIVLTYSHALDLELCHRILLHGHDGLGLIGSETKWARFRKRLADLGHEDAQISGIDCPIGNRQFGKHPQAIAVGVAAALLGQRAEDSHRQIPQKRQQRRSGNGRARDVRNE